MLKYRLSRQLIPYDKRREYLEMAFDMPYSTPITIIHFKIGDRPHCFEIEDIQDPSRKS